jgi:hypothetical protein
MATGLTVGSNYAGKEAGSIIGAAFKEADTLRLGFVTPAENVNSKLNLRKIAYTDGTVDYTCGFTPEGAIVLSEKIIDPKKVMNALQVCKETFRQTWSGDTEGASASNPNAPSDIMEAIQLELLSSQAEKIDDDIWNGVNGTNGEIGDGFIVQFAADAAVVKVGNGITSVATATTEANVEAHLKTALNAIPRALRRKDVKIGVSGDVFQNYAFYLISKGIANDGNADEKTTKFGKYTLVELGGLADNTIICAEPKNLIFATGLMGDHNELSLVDEDEIGLLTGQIRGKMVYNGGMGYYNSEEIVWFLTTA